MRTSMHAIVECNVCKHYLKLSTAEIVRQIFLEIAFHNKQCYQHPHPSLLFSPLPFHVLILIPHLALPRTNRSLSLPVPCSLKRELDVFVDNKRLVFQQAPKYLSVRLDFKQHLEEVAGKVTSTGSLIRRLAGTTWGASAKTLRISTQALVFPAAEYCAPIWSRSPHVKTADVAINSSLRTISGCLKPTPVFQLPVLTGIASAGPMRKAATLALARKAVKHDWYILHDTTNNEVPPCRLKSRKPYNKEAHDMLSVIPEDRSNDAWIAATWKQEWEAPGPTRVHRYVSDPGEGVKREDLSRKQWTTLNRLRTGVGRYKASMKKWGLADSAACECGEPEQTADHTINSCPLHRSWHLRSWAIDQSMAPTDRVNDLIWYDDTRKKKKLPLLPRISPLPVPFISSLTPRNFLLSYPIRIHSFSLTPMSYHRL